MHLQGVAQCKIQKLASLIITACFTMFYLILKEEETETSQKRSGFPIEILLST